MENDLKMQDILIFFENGRQHKFFNNGIPPQFVFKMEDNLNSLKMEINLNFLKMEDYLNFLKMEDDFIFYKLKTTTIVFLQNNENLNILKNGRRPHQKNYLCDFSQQDSTVTSRQPDQNQKYIGTIQKDLSTLIGCDIIVFRWR